jgi:predicted house-cleaning NTP pyrophosphatase (Maf/HAM1 superfamily)
MREHKDDEGVLLRVFKHVSEKAAEKAADEKAEKVVKDQTYSQWAGKMTQVSEAVLEKESRFSDQRFKGAVDKVVNEFSLVGHPAAEMIGAAVVTYAQLLADEKAEAVATEKKRVDRAVVGSKTAVTPKGDTGKQAGGKNGAAKLSPEQLRFCRDQGIDPVQYAKFVK